MGQKLYATHKPSKETSILPRSRPVYCIAHRYFALPTRLAMIKCLKSKSRLDTTNHPKQIQKA